MRLRNRDFGRLRFQLLPTDKHGRVRRNNNPPDKICPPPTPTLPL